MPTPKMRTGHTECRQGDKKDDQFQNDAELGTPSVVRATKRVTSCATSGLARAGWHERAGQSAVATSIRS